MPQEILSLFKEFTSRILTWMCDESQNLSNESHGWVAHGVSVPDVGLDDIIERFFHALKVI